MLPSRKVLSVPALLLLLSIPQLPAAQAADAAAAQALARKSDCFKCHAVDKKKDGPAYREVASKYRGKADAERTLHTHLTTNPLVEIDGEKEEHTTLKTRDDAEIRNVIQWILGL